MQTITLYGVVDYQPHSMIVALEAWVRSRQATCSARQSGDRIKVTIEGEDPLLTVLAEGVVRFYVSWRKDLRGEA